MTSTLPPRLSGTWRLGLAGTPAIGVAFGFARYGSGLFLPEFRTEFGLSVTQLGVLSSGTYAGYLAALVAVGLLAPRAGPRRLIIAAGLSATVGTALVACAVAPEMLVAGLVLAGASSGFAWAPYSDAADLMLAPGPRERVLARIPAGTAFAVAIAGPLALLTRDGGWRFAWVAFAVIGLAVLLGNARVLPSGTVPGSGFPARSFARRAAVPLYLTAFLYGLSGAVYWFFAVDAISRAARSGSATAPLFWTLTGLAGTAGVLTGGLLARLGLRRAHAVLLAAFAAAIALLGTAPGALTTVVVSAVLYGSSFMAISGLLAVWSHQVFPARPTTGFSVTLFALGLGAIAGPALLGAFADGHGLPAAFLVTAGVAALSLPFRPPR
ncbi:YbfB/YjiJ family MFS transporter [Qaidamihabitans albus]|uniref:YbfB/YjiJ family MFS transporter n=1 Tax=Qaidamihabitans albus TaxID=2795733 RepID=UPI0018F192EE|nr:YbfB/YjiJ family MFS transporter [Qaidamihabitans albus]